MIYGFSLESLSVPPPPHRGAQVWSVRRCSGSSSTNFSKNWPFLAVATYEAPRAQDLTFKLSPISSTYTSTTARFHHVSQNPAKNHLPTVAAGVLPGSSNCTFLHRPVSSQAAPPISLSANDNEINCRHKCSWALKNYVSKSSRSPRKLPQKAAGSFAPCSIYSWVQPGQHTWSTPLAEKKEDSKSSTNKNWIFERFYRWLKNKVFPSAEKNIW